MQNIQTFKIPIEECLKEDLERKLFKIYEIRKLISDSICIDILYW